MQASLESFFARRERLLAESSLARAAIDSWYEARKGSDPDLRDLATLEGLLADRRRFLEQLMQLDDDMLHQLIVDRTQKTANEN